MPPTGRMTRGEVRPFRPNLTFRSKDHGKAGARREIHPSTTGAESIVSAVIRATAAGATGPVATLAISTGAALTGAALTGAALAGTTVVAASATPAAIVFGEVFLGFFQLLALIRGEGGIDGGASLLLDLLHLFAQGFHLIALVFLRFVDFGLLGTGEVQVFQQPVQHGTDGLAIAQAHAASAHTASAHTSGTTSRAAAGTTHIVAIHAALGAGGAAAKAVARGVVIVGIGVGGLDRNQAGTVSEKGDASDEAKMSFLKLFHIVPLCHAERAN